MSSTFNCPNSFFISGRMPHEIQIPKKNRNKNASAAPDFTTEVKIAIARKKQNFVRGSRRCSSESLSTYCK